MQSPRGDEVQRLAQPGVPVLHDNQDPGDIHHHHHLDPIRATVAAYARDDLLGKRRPVMQRWADCIAGCPGFEARHWILTTGPR